MTADPTREYAEERERLLALDLAPWFLASLPPIAPELPPSVFLRRAVPRRRIGATAQQIRRRLEREPELPAVGSVIDRYRLERVVGVGGFGVVYRAHHVIDRGVVAIKLMRPTLARARPHLPALLREEARLAARINHPNVVRVLHATTADALTYIAMEYVDGPDLSVMIRRRGALPPRMVVRVIRHVAAALAAGADEDLIHRDVKPSNILLTAGGVTKLTDFGLARSGLAADPGGARGIVGTVGYMSPEQVDQPELVDFRADLYSLGVTAYHALAGRLPFPDDDAARCARAHRTVPIPPLARSIASGLRDVVMWMLAKDRDERPTSYRDLDAALRRLLSGSGEEGTTTS
jgi:serine/threonine-protein kinase